MTKKLTLVSFELCPYVQRAAIVLAEKGVAFERLNIDLANKPDWFKAISPLGKVPLLKVDDDILFESNVIVEYLDETNKPTLHPADPLMKARHRAWMEYGNAVLGDVWVLQTSSDRVAFDAKVSALKSKFEWLEPQLGSGPYFTGVHFSIVDAVFGPIFRYFPIFDKYTPLGIFDDLLKVSAWRDALAIRPSVVGAVPEDYAEKLVMFLKKHSGFIVNQ